MHSDGFGGYPFMSGIPRGQAFVDFMGKRDSAPRPATTTDGPLITPPQSGSTGISRPKSTNRMDYTLPPLSRSVQPLPNVGTSAQKQVDKTFADGSHQVDTRLDHADGTATVDTVRRSKPGMDGLQSVNVRKTHIAPDGTRTVSSRVFIVANGAPAPGIDNAEGARMIFSRDRVIPTDLAPASNERPEDIAAAQAQAAALGGKRES